MPEQFHFLRPWWLLALVPLAALLWLLWKRRLGSRGWESFCDPALLPYILSGEGGGPRRLPILVTALGGLLAILALAGPTWDKLPQPVYSSQSSLVIALDLSRSMSADDVSPSRLGRARFKIRDLLEARAEGRTALLVYAGDAFTVTPLTDDAKTIISQLQALNPDIMPARGNRADIALHQARDLLEQAGAGSGHVLLITDEIKDERAAAAARELYQGGYSVSVMGVGTEHGVPIPLGDGSFLKNDRGEIVIPTLDEGPLRDVAAAGGGLYVRLEPGDADVARLADRFAGSPAEAVKSTRLQADVWRERGPWLLLLLLPLAALAFRRGYLVVLLCLLLPLPRQAAAFDWDGLWRRDDQRARQAMEEGDHERAAQLFRDPAWKGAAEYRGGDYDGAVQSLQGLDGADNLYNLGNALARTGRYQAALEAYDKALELDPDNEDARYNRKLVEEALKRQQQQQQQQESKNGDKKQDKAQQQSGGDKGQKDPQQGRPQQDSSGRPQDSKPGQAQQQEGQKDEQESGRGQQPQQQERPQQEPSDSQRSMESERDQQQEQRPNGAPLSSEQRQADEQQQAVEQWLRRIPDDPGELLRRKFLYQYQRRQQQEGKEEEQSW